MIREPVRGVDPLEYQIERTLAPGEFIPDAGCSEFVSELEQIKERIDELIDSDAARSVTLYESFLAGCYQKAEELDDSSGSFGQFVDELFSAWIKARQAALSDPHDTAAVPQAQRTAWHERALDAAMGTDLHSQIELFLETSELGRLVEILHRSRDESLEALSHFTTEPAAKKLEETHPEMAARLWRARAKARFLAGRTEDV